MCTEQVQVVLILLFGLENTCLRRAGCARHGACLMPTQRTRQSQERLFFERDTFFGGPMRKLILGLVVLLGSVAFPRQASAGLILGQVSVSGAITVTANQLNWFNGLTPDQEAVGASNLTDGGVKVFAACAPGCPAGTVLSAKSLVLPGDVGILAVPLDLFEATNSPVTAGKVDFQLTRVFTCQEQATPTFNPECIPGGPSPFAFSYGSNGLLQASLEFQGIVFDTLTNTILNQFNGTFTTQVIYDQ